MPLSAARRRRTSTGTIVNAFCPICAKQIPENRAAYSSGTGEKQPFFESITFDPNHPFGMRLSAAGKGSLKDWEYINPDDAPELFEALKGRFKDAIKEWIERGWLLPSDIQATIKKTVPVK
jgi:hypothetical protein